MKKIVALVLSMVMVLGLATTAFGATASYALWDNDDAVGTEVTRTKVAAKDYSEVKGYGQVACWKLTFEDGFVAYFVEIAKSAATADDFFLSKDVDDDTAIMYLRALDADGKYTLTGNAVVNYVDPDADPFCGQWNLNPLTTKVYVDSEGDFYVTGSTAYMLVAGEVVAVDPADMSDMIAHEMDGVYDAKDKLVGVKCDVCGATGTVYAAANKAPFGATVFYFENAPYVLDAAVEAPATDKVESAQTFDAGIAMYVGMSVMAAAGSAICLKKKD